MTRRAGAPRRPRMPASRAVWLTANLAALLALPAVIASASTPRWHALIVSLG
jgi:hypothetical protein